MGNAKDGGFKPIKLRYEQEIEKFGNAEAKILAKAYHEFSKDELTVEEFKKLKQLDAMLDTVELIAPGSSGALLVQQNADVEIQYGLVGTDLAPHNGLNRKPGKTR